VARDFPLPTLGPKLVELSKDVHHGKGFCVIRGIDPACYAVEDLTLIYLGIQSYIAELRGRQDTSGNMLGQFCHHCDLSITDPVDISCAVHIVADDSTKQAAEHHRHSTKSIVGCVASMICLVLTPLTNCTARHFTPRKPAML